MTDDGGTDKNKEVDNGGDDKGNDEDGDDGNEANHECDSSKGECDVHTATLSHLDTADRVGLVMRRSYEKSSQISIE